MSRQRGRDGRITTNRDGRGGSKRGGQAVRPPWAIVPFAWGGRVGPTDERVHHAKEVTSYIAVSAPNDGPATVSLVPELVERSLAMLSAPEGAGKSLLALGIAQSIAAGLPWLGRPAHQAPVVYVAGEGIGGLPVRVRAWRQHHGHESRAGVFYHLGAVQLADTRDVGHLIGVTRTLPSAPVMVVIDTLARCACGLDENSTQDMGRVIAGCDRVIGETGATVLLIHHDARGTGRARGSTAIAAGMDTILSVSADGETLTLRTAKQRDAAPLPPIALRLERVLLSETESSCVVVEDHDRHTHHVPEPDRTLWTRITAVLSAGPQTLTAISEHPDVHTARSIVRTELEAARARGEVDVATVPNPKTHGPRQVDVYSLR